MNLINLALAPVILLLFYIYHKDVCEKEPKSMLIKAFLWGGAVGIIIVAVVLILVLLGFDSSIGETPTTILGAIATSFFHAAIPEELGKFIVLYLLVWKSKHFDEHFDGIVYATFVSLGFAAFENILYVVQGGVSVAIVRTITAVPAHFLFGVMMGYYFSLAKFGDSDQRKKNFIIALVLPIILHGVYDSLIYSVAAIANSLNAENISTNEELISIVGEIVMAFIALMIGMWISGLNKVKALVEKDTELLEKGERLINKDAPVELEGIKQIESLERISESTDISYSGGAFENNAAPEDGIVCLEAHSKFDNLENLKPVSFPDDPLAK